ncbi:MAG TPA: heterodisulfide reductase-related iron-sulfur binding cluster [Planctomycetota bacterium]|nr:heterodisulfide reductase-related iron-sulfur binding cluster [Planctomycetota bacterium]
MNDKELVDYAHTLDCIHCGLCLRTCPTYQLTGNESSSPRGRIALMRAVAEDRLDAREPEYGEELDFCLVCRHCESVCPAGVRFGEMMEHARSQITRAVERPFSVRFVRWAGFSRGLRSRFLLARAHGALRLAQESGMLAPLANLLGTRGAALASLPSVPPARERELLPLFTPAQGTRRGVVSMLEGCVMPELFGRVNRATARVLATLGFDVRTTRAMVCCGALHAHNGELEGARELARTMIAAFEATDAKGEPATPIVVNSAGCGAHMKELGRLLEGDAAWSERARRFAERVVDFSEFVAPRLAPELALRLPPRRIAYDDPCHLCHGQKIRREPRAILDRIAGLERVEMPGSESCCGSAGIYSILRPDDARAVLAPKLAEFAATGADTLVTANPGCQLQWRMGLDRAQSSASVVHVAELLDAALQLARET